jgi:hypothetical protein
VPEGVVPEGVVPEGVVPEGVAVEGTASVTSSSFDVVSGVPSGDPVCTSTKSVGVPEQLAKARRDVATSKEDAQKPRKRRV